MVNRYDQPAQAQFINTYAPIPFQQLYTLGKEANARVDKAIADLSGALDKWSDFRSPSAKDTKAWYDETIGRAKPIVDQLSSNIEMLKTPEGRAQINSLINNVDRFKLSTLKQSKEGMEQRMKMNQQLAAAGKFNEAWHGVDFANYDTSANGIYNDVSPLAYKDIRELADPYYAKLQKGYLYTKGGYDYFGNTLKDLEDVADSHLNDIVNTPEAQKHMQMYKKRTGADDTQALQWFRDSIIESNIDRTIRPTREVNDFARLNYAAGLKAAAKKGEESGAMPVQFTTKLAASLMDKPSKFTAPDGKTFKYNSQVERIQSTFAPGSKWAETYINRQDPNGTQLPMNRNKSASNIISQLAVDIGSQAQFINDAELDKSTVIKGITGAPIYSGTNLNGLMTQEQYVNSKMGLSVNEANWNPARVAFEQDLISGAIPNTGITPTSKVLLENGLPGDEVYTQEYKAYIPVQYFIDNAEKYGFAKGRLWGTKDPDKLLEDEGFNNFLKSLNGRIPSSDGKIVNIPSVRTATDGDFSAGAAVQYNGAYVEIPVMRGVLTNQQTRERANQEEFQYTKMGSKNNALYRADNENLIYGQ